MFLAVRVLPCIVALCSVGSSSEILSARGVVNGLSFQLDPYGNNGVRVRVAEQGTAIGEPLKGALRYDSGSDAVADVTQTKYIVGDLSVRNGNLQVEVSSAGFPVATRLSDGFVLLEVEAFVFAGPAIWPHVNSSNSQSAQFKGYTQEIYGLGEHGLAGPDVFLNRFPYNKTFADSLFYGKSSGSDVSIPWYASSAGYGFVWNTPSLGNVSLSNNGLYWGSMDSRKNIDFWITTTSDTPSKIVAQTGKSFYLELLHQYVDAVGHASPIPYFATGFIQSKDRYRNQSQVIAVAREYRRRQLPISMLVIDWFHWPEMGDFKFKPACFPDPQAMVEELHGLGIELMVTLWPYIGFNVSRNWETYFSKGYLATSTATGEPNTTSFWRYNTPTGNALIDFTHPGAQNATFWNWYDGYGKYGIKAIWMDQTEPDHTLYVGGGQWSFHAGSDAQIMPAWVRYYVDGFADGLRSVGHNDGDFFILARNAWAGTWANGAALWSGDIASSWDALRVSVQGGQGVGMSGIALWTTDIGGYRDGDPGSPDFQEMIVRWFQFGAFCPVFRTHGHRLGGPNAMDGECWVTNGDNEIWNLAKDAVHYDALATVLRLRESLRDYVVGINKETVATGIPMMRPMFLEFPNDPVSQTPPVWNQYMFGPDWLISPVTSPKAKTWPVYLPPLPSTHEWVYWWNQTVTRPGNYLTWNVTAISEFPLFFRRPVQPVVELPPVQDKLDTKESTPSLITA